MVRSLADRTFQPSGFDEEARAGAHERRAGRGALGPRAEAVEQAAAEAEARGPTLACSQNIRQLNE